jgi:DNA-binding transcriptional regulator YiaG
MPSRFLRNVEEGGGVLTNQEFKRLRQELYPTQAAAARALGVTRMAVHHWESGYRPVPEMAAKLLRTLKENTDEEARV